MSLAIATSATKAEASDGRADFRIDSTACSPAFVEETQRLTLVELNSSNRLSGADAPRVSLSCSDLVVSIHVSLTGQWGARQLDLEHTESALRPRVLALAIAELVRDTANAEAPAAPSPVTQPRQTSRQNEVLAAPGRVASANRVSLFAVSHNFGSHFEPLIGGGFGFSRDAHRLSFSVGPELSTSQRNTALGRVRVLAGDLSARIAFRFPSRLGSSEIGLGYGVGYARITAQSASAEVTAGRVQGVWAGPFVFGVLEPHLSSRLFLRLAAQAGYVTLPVRGHVALASDSELAGLWLGLSLGFGWAL